MENYCTLPRQLIYKDRRTLAEFGIDDENSINSHISNALLRLDIISKRDSRCKALQCFNDAYYICTLILLEDNPSWFINDYEEMALRPWEGYYADKYKSLTIFLVYFYFTHFSDEINDKKKLTFCELIHRIIKDYNSYVTEFLNTFLGSNVNNISTNEFQPRVIDAQTIKDVERTQFRWRVKTNYFSDEIIAEIINDLGKNNDEKIELIKMFNSALDNEFCSNDCYKEEKKELLEKMEKEIKGEELQEQTTLQKNEVGLPLTTAQCSLFCEALARKLNFTFSNKKTDLAPMVKKIFGCGEKSAANKLTSGYNRDDREKVASIFDNLSPDFANFIRTFGKSQ